MKICDECRGEDNVETLGIELDCYGDDTSEKEERKDLCKKCRRAKVKKIMRVWSEGKLCST